MRGRDGKAIQGNAVGALAKCVRPKKFPCIWLPNSSFSQWGEMPSNIPLCTLICRHSYMSWINAKSMDLQRYSRGKSIMAFTKDHLPLSRWTSLTQSTHFPNTNLHPDIFILVVCWKAKFSCRSKWGKVDQVQPSWWGGRGQQYQLSKQVQPISWGILLPVVDSVQVPLYITSFQPHTLYIRMCQCPHKLTQIWCALVCMYGHLYTTVSVIGNWRYYLHCTYPMQCVIGVYEPDLKGPEHHLKVHWNLGLSWISTNSGGALIPQFPPFSSALVTVYSD